MSELSISRKISLYLILACAVFWLAFGLIVAFDLHPALPQQEYIKPIFSTLSYIASAALLAMFFLLKKVIKAAFYITSAMLLVVIVLTLTDEFGLADLLVLILHTVPLVMLVKDRISIF